MLGWKRMPRPLSESRKPESRRKTAVLRGMRLRRIDSPLDFPGQPCACGGGKLRAAVYRIGIDVGGTFTDLVAVDDFGRATLAKVLSTPEDPSVAGLDGLKLLADMLGLELGPLLSETERIVHGTTVATNALL